MHEVGQLIIDIDRSALVPALVLMLIMITIMVFVLTKLSRSNSSPFLTLSLFGGMIIVGFQLIFLYLFNKQDSLLISIQSTALVACLVLFLYLLPQTRNFILCMNFLAAKIVKIFFYCSISLFSFALLHIPFLMLDKAPLAILDQEGISVKHFGFIAWNEIEKFTLHQPPGKKKSSIEINVKNPNLLSKQADWQGKLSLFCGKIVGNYHMTFSNINIQNQKVKSFAQQYIKTD